MSECLAGPGYNAERLSIPYVPQVTGNELSLSKHQRWEVVEYKYFVTVLKYMFLVSVLYSTTYFPDDFLLSTSHMLNTNTCTFYFLHVEPKYLYFLLLTFPKQAGSFSLNVCLVA